MIKFHINRRKQHNSAAVNVSASHVRSSWFKPQRLHSSFSLMPTDFAPVAHKSSSLEWGSIELKPMNLFIYLYQQSAKLILTLESSLDGNKAPSLCYIIDTGWIL